jgi:hypothetical protein
MGERNKIISAYSLKNTGKEFFHNDTFLFNVNGTSEDAWRIANEIFSLGIVNYANPDVISFNPAETNDTFFSNQWPLEKIFMSDAW